MNDPENTNFLRKLIQDVADENVDLKAKNARLEQRITALLIRIDELTEAVDEATIEEFVAKHDTDIERYITTG